GSTKLAQRNRPGRGTPWRTASAEDPSRGMSFPALQFAVEFALSYPRFLRQAFERGLFVETLVAHELPEPHAQVGGGGHRLLRRFRLADQEHDLPFHLTARAQLSSNAFRGPAQELFVDLRQLAGHHDRSPFAEGDCNVFERGNDAMRRLVTY